GEAVPLGRLGGLAAGRQHRIPGPDRPPGQNPRVPDRVGRNRDAASERRGRGRSGGARPSVRRGREGACRLLCGGPDADGQ
uniref:hypothetical protein n=1 Tax=Paenibacillus sp. EKM207P TaxID=1683675 RepID=UPI001EECDFEF